MATFSIVEATIDEIQANLLSGALTSVELVALYLRRISSYDCCGLSLNSIPILNNDVFEEAAASDDRRATGHSARPLEGIPYTVKDSYLVKGMTVACGSPAFEHLVGQEDAFTVQAIRAAGGVLLGRTNMPPMAYGGMQRGIYGRAESPYNSKYLAAAFWSGSSNGSAVATSASFAAFGMGEETVSSGRSPASNNALVAYTPSRGWISIRGNWPLYPTCDVVVPHTRTMRDMLTLLDVITIEDPISRGDFWRDQPFVQLDKPWSKGPHSFREIEHVTSLSGIRIAVPSIYIGGTSPPGVAPVVTCPEVIALWKQARRDLESLGAEVVIVPDFPIVNAYENPDLLPEGYPRLPINWKASERGPLIAHGWNEFLRRNNDPNLPDISSVDSANIYPEFLRTPAELKVLDRSNAIHFAQLSEYIHTPLYETKNLEAALIALEGMRKCLLEDWLSALGCDCAVFPAAGDVAKADADVNEESAIYAKKNGVFYSHGNWALRHLGVPTVSVPMGIMAEKKMPMNLTFAGKANDDANLLRYANAYEMSTKNRLAPPLTPEIPSDHVSLHVLEGRTRAARPTLKVEKFEVTPDHGENLSALEVRIEGTIAVTKQPNCQSLNGIPELEVWVGKSVAPAEQVIVQQKTDTLFHFTATARTQKPIERDQREKTHAPVARDKTMVVILARAKSGGKPSGWLRMV